MGPKKGKRKSADVLKKQGNSTVSRQKGKNPFSRGPVTKKRGNCLPTRRTQGERTPFISREKGKRLRYHRGSKRGGGKHFSIEGVEKQPCLPFGKRLSREGGSL